MKRIFAIPYFTMMGVVSAFTLLRYLESGAWPWLGPLLVAGGSLVWFAGALLPRMARTSHPVVIASVLAGVGVAGYAAYDDLGAQPLWWSVGAAGLHVLYLVWYAHRDARSPRSDRRATGLASEGA